MRIFFSITYYFPYLSGLTLHVERLSEKLKDRGHIVSVLTSQYEKKLPVHEKGRGVSIVRVPYLFKISKGFFMPFYPIYVILAIKRAEIVVVNLPQFEAFIVSLLSTILKKQVYCIYHCEVKLPLSFSNIFIEYALHISHLISLTCSRKIITYTKDFANHSKLLPHFSQKLVYIYPPIPSPSVDRKLELALEKKLPKDRKYVIGVAARIAAEKGIEYLFGAIPLLIQKLGNKFIIVIAGPKNPVGEEKYWQEINQFIKTYKENILFLGAITPGKMGSFYSLLDVLVLPSVNSTESFGMVQVEAMLCGVPVVASDLPGVRIPIKVTGMGEVAKLKDLKDLAEKIVTTLLNRKKYMKDKKDIEALFSFSKTLEAYEKIFT